MWKEILSFFQANGLLIAATALIAYLLGSVSFSILITRAFEKKADIRTMGSGNAGFTNVLRSVGKLPAILTFAGDFGKSALAVFIGKMIFQHIGQSFVTPAVIMQYGAYLAGFCCLMGHIFPCYFGFKGGKGVLTTAAMILLIDWRVFLILLVIFGIMFALSRIISLSSVTGVCCYPVVTFLVTYFVDYIGKGGAEHSAFPISYVFVATAITLLISAVVVIKHRSNIKRILAGTEGKIQPRKR